MTIVMFDTNFFRKFVEDPTFYNKVNNYLGIRYKGIPPQNMAMFVSPFCFLEYAGITIPTPDEPKDIIEKVKGKSFEEMVGLAEASYYRALKYFQEEANINTERIMKELANRKKYVHKDAEKYWEIATKRYSIEGNLPIIHHLLACDFLQKVPLKRAIAQYYHPSLWMDSARRISQGSDVCLFRTIKWRWDAENKVKLIMEYGKFQLQKLNTAMGVRFKDDFLDTEIIHYTCFGKVDGTNILPVDTFTCDPSEKIKNRIKVFSVGLDKTITEINTTVDNTGKTWIFKFPSPSPGSITFFDFSGNLVEGPITVPMILKS